MRRAAGGSGRLRSTAKSPSGGETSLQRFESAGRAGGPKVVHLELAAPILRVQLDVAVREDLAPVARRERDLRGLHREEHALQLPDVVAKREVHMADRRASRRLLSSVDP